jgi:GTP-binding protein
MFIDHVSIQVQSGAGGNGMVAWRREKYVPHGGPAGGDGGRGGHVILEASADLNTLLDFRYQSLFKAEDGEKGRIKNQYGHNGQDLVIKVPCGTVVKDDGRVIADLTRPGQRALVATGGRGGRGNTRFASAGRQSPQFAEPGEPSITRTLSLELKLIADVGIIGLPNAGKSTLISVLSAAKPKIADYPFTTLVPNLGVVKKPEGGGVVLADIPGLIEGASEGHGLGHSFLRHVERTRLLIHLIALSGEETTPLQRFELINQELARYSATLAKKPQLVVLSKADTVDEETAQQAQKQLQATLNQPVWVLSAAAHTGLDTFKNALLDTLAHLQPEPEEALVIAEDTKAWDHDDSAFTVEQAPDGTFVVEGGKVARLVGVTDMKNGTAVFRLRNILTAMGVFDALEQAGAKEGDTISMAGYLFEYDPY